MPLSICLCFLLLCSAFSLKLNGQSKDEDVNFPTDDEIRLVLTQADRAIDEYKPLLDQEEQMLGKEGAEAVANDRGVVASLELAIKGFRKNPQAFNGPLGFAFFEWLDDASRNAVLCSSNAMNKAFTTVLGGDKDQAMSNLNLSQSCVGVSTLLYTVSENAGALYSRYVKGEEQTAKEGLRVAAKCTDILKQKGVIPKQ